MTQYNYTHPANIKCSVCNEHMTGIRNKLIRDTCSPCGGFYIKNKNHDENNSKQQEVGQ